MTLLVLENSQLKQRVDALEKRTLGDRSLTALSSFGSQGNAKDQFNQPWGIEYRPSDGAILVVDNGNHRVVIYHSGLSSPAVITVVGSFGSGNGQFKNPTYICLGKDGDFIVSDRDNFRIQILSFDGTFKLAFGSSGTSSIRPYGVGYSPTTDEIYVADEALNNIQVFAYSGTFLRAFGGSGSGQGQLNNPNGLSLDSNGDVYVAEHNNHRIQVFSPQGQHIRFIGQASEGQPGQTPRGVRCVGDRLLVSSFHVIRIYNKSSGQLMQQLGSTSTGTALGQFNYPFDLTIDDAGHILVSDTENHRIQVIQY